MPGVNASESEHKRGNGTLKRPIPAAITEFMQLLNRPSGVTSSMLRPIVNELEADYHSVLDHFGAAPQHEADAANTMNYIIRTLSDYRLRRFGITSKLVEEREQAAAPVKIGVGHHR